MGVYDELARLDEKTGGKLGKARLQKHRPGKTDRSDTTTPSNHDTTVSRYHDSMIQAVKSALRQFGKEAATHRFTPEEKRAVADIIYSYSRQGLKTSENEIARIGVNFILNDYKDNGEESLLHRVLKALRE